MIAHEADKVIKEREILYSICTLVSDKNEYGEMLGSFTENGFSGPSCEFLFLNNTKENRFDAYAGLNIFLRASRGKYLIICHQDILLYDDINILNKRIEELDLTDSTWAVLGNAGGKSLGHLAIRISDPHGKDIRLGQLPERVQSVDENFIVIRSDANLALSGDLSGFHMYGTDLCIVASILGYSAYVVDFHVLHKSSGKVGRRGDNNSAGFYAACYNLISKYGRAMAPRYIQTTCTKLFVSGSKLLNQLANTAKAKRLATRFNKRKKQSLNN